jgi:hypothetical protein
MKVLNLSCSNGHLFEGWFASEADFLSQQSRQLVECPVCSCSSVDKRPSAPRLSLKRASPDEVGRPDALPPSARDALPQPTEESIQGAYLRALRQLINHTQDVGERFAEEARRMHYGEVEAKAIRGRATPAERDALREEGVDFQSVPDFASGSSSLQ